MQENRDVEFKGEYSDTLIKTAVAFSNGEGGRILVGVDDDGNIIGLQDPDDTCKKCAQMLADKIRPDITTTSSVGIQTLDGKSIVVITINEGARKPYYIRDKGMRPEGVYIRKGTSSVPATEEMFYRLTHNAVSASFEQFISLNQELTFDYLKTKMIQKGLAFDEKHMESLHMIKDGKYTNLAFILSDQFDQPIKMATFPDHFKSRFIDRDIAEGSVLEQADKAIDYIMKHDRTTSIIVGMQRRDSLMFPEIAVREAVLNAVVHRDYSSNATTLISIFPDNLTIVSPGDLYSYYSEAELFQGVSSLRNKGLADIMYRLELIEAYGTGLPRIMDQYQSSRVKPSVLPGASTFTIVLPAIGAEEKNELDSFLSSHAEFTRQELQESLNMNKSNAVSKINELLAGNRIAKVGEGRGTRYRTIRID